MLATTGPVEIRQPMRSLWPPFAVVLGNAGNMQAIHGEVTVIGDNAALPTIPLAIEQLRRWHVADGVRFLSVARIIGHCRGTRSGDHSCSGKLCDARRCWPGPAIIRWLGPNATNLWEINATNGGKLNGKFTYSGFANLVGGRWAMSSSSSKEAWSAAISMAERTMTSFASIHSCLPDASTIDLPAGIVPRINGIVTNVEAVIVPLAIVPIANRSSVAGATIVPFNVLGSGGVASLTVQCDGIAGRTDDRLSDRFHQRHDL